MKLGVSQSLYRATPRSPTPRLPCQGDRLLAGPVDAEPGTLVARAKVGRFALAPSRSGRGEGRWAGSRRLWWRRGGRGGRGGAGGVFLELASVPVVMQRQVPAVLRFEGAPDSVLRQCWSANCADDRRDSPGAALGRVLDMPVVVHRHMHSPRMSRSSTTLSWRRGCLPWS